MNLLLTGGTGFFGRALLRHWLAAAQAGAQVPTVTVLSRSAQTFCAQYSEFAGQRWLRLHQGDILEPASLPEGGDFTHVLHAAADSTDGPRLSPLQRYVQIVDGTRHLLDYAVAHRIPRFLLTSSGGVYGPQPSQMETIDEYYTGMPDPLNAAHAYSVAKRCAEHLCVLYRQQFGVEVVIARCFAFVGRDLPLDVHFAIGNFIRDALEAPVITVSGDGTPVRSYMDQRDLAHWLEVLLHQGQAGQAYNVGSDVAITIGELAYLVRDTLAPHKSVSISAKAAGDASFRNRYVPSIDKARIELGLELQYPLMEAIEYAAQHARRGAAEKLS
ncbi:MULTISPECIES: NAD-dependent epimerase/dehydratase family protein [Pseudomonas putida group]|uniref:NAD-dependent epimerase/dehydratase family protein n=1 Tax=Pseudomonas putida group TaxID=136845 RepID=UPI00051D0A51|nr:NAD(P)-dependent oxidoreductase [Pseudomonas plecoglossicida]KGK26801.1 UDP-glucose 4-epimerase [Pseudomonas plecoglossicida]